MCPAYRHYRTPNCPYTHTCIGEKRFIGSVVHMHTCPHVRMPTSARVHMHAGTHSRMGTHTGIQAACIHVHTYTCAQVHAYACTHAHKYIGVHGHGFTCNQATGTQVQCTRVHMHTCTRVPHVRIYTCALRIGLFAREIAHDVREVRGGTKDWSRAHRRVRRCTGDNSGLGAERIA